MSDKKYKVPNSTSIRFGEKSRIQGMENSINNRQYDNLTAWIREAIDLRLYLEGRRVEVEYVLSGDFLSDMEKLSSHHAAEASDVTNPAVLSDEKLGELIKTVLRTHAMSRTVCRVILDNPNVNTLGGAYSYDNVMKNITDKTEQFYEAEFSKEQ